MSHGGRGNPGPTPPAAAFCPRSLVDLVISGARKDRDTTLDGVAPSVGAIGRPMHDNGDLHVLDDPTVALTSAIDEEPLSYSLSSEYF